MSKVCPLCDKRYNVAVNRVKARSRYNPTSTHRQLPNLQWTKDADGKRIKVCVKCLKTLAKKSKKN
ncbi:MAG: 50S ribosomal protein L28 [Candidatus Parcubacteria bacterium]|nr:50S ribosomal protein L28 [Candidatus Parcubacteria bacterium]